MNIKPEFLFSEQDITTLRAINRGVDLKRAGQLNDAISWYRLAIQQNPLSWMAHHSLAKSLFLVNDMTAIYHYLMAISITGAKLRALHERSHPFRKNTAFVKQTTFSFFRNRLPMLVPLLSEVSIPDYPNLWHGWYLLVDVNTLDHLGHAATDNSGDAKAEIASRLGMTISKLEYWVNDYRNGLGGKPSMQTPPELSMQYLRQGIKWLVLHMPEVLSPLDFQQDLIALDRVRSIKHP